MALIVGVLAVGAAAIALDCWLYPQLAKPSHQNFNTGQNGLWLGSKWYQGKVDESQITNLGKQLSNQQIRFAYFHCRDITRDGSLRVKSKDSVTKLTKALHDLSPNIQVIAWVGAVNAITGGEVDVSKAPVRTKMAQEAGWLVNECGFDGIQWDYEPCPDGDDGALKLLAETRASIGPARSLGIAAPRSWSTSYISRISNLCDQIALMDYDTSIFWPRLYAWMVANDIVRFTTAIKSPCKLIEGVPTYEEERSWHHPHTENLLISLIGVKQGLTDKHTNRDVFAGIAPYAEFTTSPQEWQIYRKYWLDK